MKPLVLYHAACVDGFCSAWVAHCHFGDDAEYVPVQYGQEPPDVTGRVVYILDFSYKRPVMRQILSRAHKVVVLDHHKTAETELAGIVDEFVQRPDLIANPLGSELPFVRFDMNKSGGWLALEHFNPFPCHHAPFPGCHLPWLVDYTQDYDLWRKQLPYSDEINAFIRSHPFDFKLWDRWHRDASPGSDLFHQFVAEGAAVLRYQRQVIDVAVSHAREIEMDGHKVLAVNSTSLFSEIAGELARDRPFGAAWFVRGDGVKVWSLRSREGGIDVSEVAKRRGGGGHRNAAGFQE